MRMVRFDFLTIVMEYYNSSLNRVRLSIKQTYYVDITQRIVYQDVQQYH